MSQDLFERFQKGEEVYFVSEQAEKLTHLQGTLLEDVTSETRVIRLLNADGEEVLVDSSSSPEWNVVEAVDGFGLLFLKLDSDRVVYLVVAAGEDNVMLEPDSGLL
jgi:hypothetical protein